MKKLAAAAAVLSNLISVVSVSNSCASCLEGRPKRWTISGQPSSITQTPQKFCLCSKSPPKSPPKSPSKKIS